MNTTRLFLLIFVFSFQISFAEAQQVNRKVLPISPVTQNTYVWCWAATAEMVFKYYNLPNANPGGDFQCGIVAAYFGSNSMCWSNCYSCIVPIESMSNMLRLVNLYGSALRQIGVGSSDLSSSVRFNALTVNEVINEINNRRPVLAGISPGQQFSLPNASQHVALITGYEVVNQQVYLIVNDPFPFWHQDFTGSTNPYFRAGGIQVQVGQYKLLFDSFRTRLNWGNTIYEIHSLN